MRRFKDGLYLSAIEKEKVSDHWQRFLKSDLNPNLFTKALYADLHLHWGFIAHFNQDGFYHARFASPEGLLHTLEQMQKPGEWVFRDANTSGCADLHKVMHESLIHHGSRLAELALARQRSQLRKVIACASEELSALSSRSNPPEDCL